MPRILSQEFAIGMYGIAKTFVGYFAASVSMRFDVDNLFVRFTLTFFFYFFHQFFYWIMRRALLGQQVPLDPQKIFLQAVLNRWWPYLYSDPR